MFDTTNVPVANIFVARRSTSFGEVYVMVYGIPPTLLIS